MHSVISRPPKGFESDGMNSQDPASLQNLNDIVLPEAVAWWPLASGWYYLSGVLLIALAWFVYRVIRRWHSNAYRRAALHQLQVLTNDIEGAESRDAGLRQLPVLLKRTALSVYPRGELASLTGERWLDFLNSKVSTASFNNATATLLDQLSYSVGELSAVDTKTANELLTACRHWLKNHQPDPQHKPGMKP
jgi:hypothetical protein